MSIVTRTGDRGETSLFGGERVKKYHLRLESYGTIDELNAILGLSLAEGPLSGAIIDQVLLIQRTLFSVGSDLATPSMHQPRITRIAQSDIDELEQWISNLEATLPALTRFILPSGSTVGCHLHHARTVCRRAERHVVALCEQEPESTNPLVTVYLNRLSDYLFLVAREANRQAGATEVEVV